MKRHFTYQPLFIGYLVLLVSPVNCLLADDINDYFSMSPAELASISVDIASGSMVKATQAAAIVSVVTYDQIKTMGATQLYQVLEMVPGVHVSFDQRSNGYFYSMRGIRNENSSEILILLNGTRVSLPYRGGRVAGFTMPTDNIAKVEVIRGPGSAIYGADAFAGVINIVTKSADDIEGITVGGRVGSWSSYDGWLQYGKQWQGWDVALNFQYQNSQGDDGRIIDIDQQIRIDAANNTTASLAPGAMATDYNRWNAQLSMQRKHWEMHFWAAEQIDGGTGVGVTSVLDPDGQQTSKQYLFDLNYSTEDLYRDWQFDSKLSYLYSRFNSTFHLFPEGAVIPIGHDGNPSATNAVGRILFVDGMIGIPGREYHMPSIEVTSHYQGWNNHSLRLAMGYRYESISTTERKNFGPGVITGTEQRVDGTLFDVSGSENVYLPDDNRSIWSASVQDEWAVTPALLLTIGVRNDYYSDFGNTLNPRASLVWSVNDELTAKLLYGRAFRPPSFTEQGNQNNPVILGNRNLQPETIDTVELAFDYLPFDRLHTAINFFYYHLNDGIMFMPDAGENSSTAQNVGEKKSYGFEFEWNWHVIDSVRLMGNYTVQHSYFIQSDSIAPAVPVMQVYSALNWTFYPQWFIQPQVNWVGDRHRNNNDTRQKMDDYAIVDIVIGTKKLAGMIAINAAVKNLLNADAREDGSTRIPNDIPLPGRSFFIEVSVDY